jgi:hypothetical protein
MCQKNVKKALESIWTTELCNHPLTAYSLWKSSLRQVVTKPHYLTMLLNLKSSSSSPRLIFYLGRLYYEGHWYSD